MPNLTTAQLTTLKAHILASADLAPISSGPSTDYNSIAIALNANASPAQNAWLTAAPVEAIDEASTWTTFDGLSAGKRDSWRFFLDRPRDFTRAKVRSWITDVWGNATADSAAEKLLQAGTEKASRAEVAIGGTTRTTGTVSALDRAWIGDVTISDVAAAMAS